MFLKKPESSYGALWVMVKHQQDVEIAVVVVVVVVVAGRVDTGFGYWGEEEDYLTCLKVMEVATRT